MVRVIGLRIKRLGLGIELFLKAMRAGTVLGTVNSKSTSSQRDAAPVMRVYRSAIF